MSTLSETLERHLRELQNPKPKQPPTSTPIPPGIGGGKILLETALYYNQGSSDKEYHISVVDAYSGFVVNFEYGRRGGNLQKGTKTPYPVSFLEAKDIYNKLKSEKKGKGYREK